MSKVGLALLLVLGAALKTEACAYSPTYRTCTSVVDHLSGWGIAPVMRVRPLFWGSTFTGGDSLTQMNQLKAFYLGLPSSDYIQTKAHLMRGNSISLSVDFPPPDYSSSLTSWNTHKSQWNSGSLLQDYICTNLADSLQTYDYVPIHVDFTDTIFGYCGWHSVGVCGSAVFAYGLIFNGASGCNSGTGGSTAYSAYTAGAASIAAHELMETMSDFDTGGGWYTDFGAETEDLCAWVPGFALVGDTRWYVQAAWMNDVGCVWAPPAKTSSPTRFPTNNPTTRPPTKQPTHAPTKPPTTQPTHNPTKNPTFTPTKAKSATREPTTKNPTRDPTRKPTRHPTKKPTHSPTKGPTHKPTRNPTKKPTHRPTRASVQKRMEVAKQWFF